MSFMVIQKGAITAAVSRRRGKPEEVEQEHVKQILRSMGAKFWVAGTRRKKADYQGTMQTPGLADLPLVFLPRRIGKSATLGAPTYTLYDFLVIEMKSPAAMKKKYHDRSREQMELAELCKLAGVNYVCGDAKTVVQWLIQYEYLKRGSIAAHWMEP